MEEERYRIERVLTVFAVIMLGVIIFTAMNFFGVIDTKTAGSSYCIFPKYFSCDKLIVTHDSISFELRYDGGDLYDFKVTSDTADCTRFEKDLFITKDPLNIKLTCTTIAPKGTSFKDELTLGYSGGRSVGLTKAIAKIKSKVE